MPLAAAVQTSGAIGRQIRQSADLVREYRGYVWSQWFRQNLPQMLTLFAAFLGTARLLLQSERGGALFILSMPVPRSRLIRIRAAVGLAELLALPLIPSLLISLFSPAVGETYSVGSAMVHAACAFIAAAPFFCLAFLLSTVFSDLWRPLLIALGVAAVVALCTQVSAAFARYSIFRLMSGEAYFTSGRLPWLGLLLCATASAAILQAALVNFERQDL
jgi:hypothetical protein